MPSKASPENITLFHVCYVAIISTRLTSPETENYAGTKLVGVAFSLRKRMKHSPFVCSRSPRNLAFGHIMLLFCRGPQRNAPKFNTHLQSD